MTSDTAGLELWKLLQRKHPGDLDTAIRHFDELIRVHRESLIRRVRSRCYDGTDIEDCLQIAAERINLAIVHRMGFVENDVEPDSPAPANLHLFKPEYGFQAFVYLVLRDVVRTENRRTESRRTLRNRYQEFTSEQIEPPPSPLEKEDVIEDLLSLLTPRERFVLQVSCIPFDRQGLLEVMTNSAWADEAVKERIRRFQLPAERTKLRQKDIAALVGISPKSIGRIISSAKGLMREKRPEYGSRRKPRGRGLSGTVAGQRSDIADGVVGKVLCGAS